MSLRSFLPFIVFAALSGAAWQWAAVAAFVIGVRILMQDRKAGTPGSRRCATRSTGRARTP